MVLATIVNVMIITILIKTILAIWNYLRREDFIWNTNNGQYWAVVTGSTDGIGFEFARQLAQKGYNLLLLSRNEDKLMAKRQQILVEFPQVQIKILAVDFKKTNIYDDIRKFLQPNLDNIFILINNVGFGPTVLNKFTDEEFSLHQDLINVNLLSAMRMTELILPKMLEQKRGLVVNVSSFLSLHVAPMITAYGSTKAFVTYFSRALNFECSKNNVLVYTLTPGSVSTNLLKIPPSLLVPSARKYVRNALRSINWTTPESCGYLPHTFGSAFFFIIEYLIGWKRKTEMFAMFSKQAVNKQDEITLNLGSFTSMIANSFKNQEENGDNNNKKKD